MKRAANKLPCLLAWVSLGTCAACALVSPGDRPMVASLSRYYFPSPEAEARARKALYRSLAALDTNKSGFRSGKALAEAFRRFEEVLVQYARHDGYLRLRCADNRTDPACGDNDRLDADFASKTAFLNPEVLAIPKKALDGFFRSTAELRPYRYAIESIRRASDHTLSPGQEGFLQQLQPEIGDWQYDLYSQISSGIDFGKVHTADGDLDPVRQRNLIATNSDPAVREEGFKRRFDGMAGRRDLFAFALVNTVKAQNALAIAHRYKDAPTRKYESLQLDPGSTVRLLAEMASHGDVARRFERIRSKDYEDAFGTPPHVWDLAAAKPGQAAPHFALAEVPVLIHHAIDLGPKYLREFDALLNPANERADILPKGAERRYGGGFSVGYANSPAMLFCGQFAGTFKDVSVIAHEGGHAVHRALMNEHGVHPLYARGPNYLFESFAEFNELLLADYLAEHADNA